MDPNAEYRARLAALGRRGRLLEIKLGLPRYALTPELRGNPYHDPANGRFTSGPGGGLTKSGGSGTIKSSQKVSATGENRFEKGFTEKNLDGHWNGSTKAHSHKGEYPEWTKEQYAARALELVQSAADGENILGYVTKDGAVARYDTRTNDYVKGYPNGGIKTMFKPDLGRKYFENWKKQEGIDDES